MRFLLDTNVLSHLIRAASPELTRRFAAAGPQDLAISAITWAELHKGLRAVAPRRAAELKGDLEVLAAEISVVPFDVTAAERAGEVLAQLKRAGTPIGPYDALIAGHALALECTLVTNNTREFRRVKGLRIEDWTSSEND